MLDQRLWLAAVLWVVLWQGIPEAREHSKAGLWILGGVAAAYYLLRELTGRWRLMRHRRRLAHLETFAKTLDEGRIECLRFENQGRAVVSGALEGLALRLTVHAKPPSAIYEVWISNNPLEFDVSRYSLGTQLRRQRRLPVLPIPVLRNPARQARLEAAVQDLLGPVGLDRVRLDHYRLRGEERGFTVDTNPERLLDVFRTLGRIARVCQRTEVHVNGLSGAHFAWGEGGSMRCPYCHDGYAPDESDLTSCPGCRTLHHGECFDEAGGCTLLGCTRSRAERLAWRPETTRRAKA